jgi:hypothetical protein
MPRDALARFVHSWNHAFLIREKDLPVINEAHGNAAAAAERNYVPIYVPIYNIFFCDYIAPLMRADITVNISRIEYIVG